MGEMILSWSNLTKQKFSSLKPPIGGFLKWWYPQNTPKWSFLVGKPMVVEYHHFRKPPISHQGSSLSPPEIWGQKWWFLDPPGREVVAHEAMYDPWSRLGTRETQPRSPQMVGLVRKWPETFRLKVKDFFDTNCPRMIEKPYQGWCNWTQNLSSVFGDIWCVTG